MKSFNLLMLSAILMVGACSTKDVDDLFKDKMKGVTELHTTSSLTAKVATYDADKHELTITAGDAGNQGIYEYGTGSLGTQATFTLSGKPDLVMTLLDSAEKTDPDASIFQAGDDTDADPANHITKIDLKVFFKK